MGGPMGALEWRKEAEADVDWRRPWPLPDYSGYFPVAAREKKSFFLGTF